MLLMITIFHELNRAKSHFGVVYERFISFISFMPLDFELFYEARFENSTKTHHVSYSARTAILPCFSFLVVLLYPEDVSREVWLLSGKISDSIEDVVIIKQ